MTTPSITIEETTPEHLHLMAEAMTSDSADTAKKLGLSPKKALWHSYRKSIICKTALIDGKIAAIWGISGNMFSEAGRPFLILTPESEKYPLRTAFRYRKELNNFNKMFPTLHEWVPKDNEKSIRLLELMGFKVSKNEVQIGDAMFLFAERRLA